MLEEARRLINIGLPIIPVCSHDHKHCSPRHVATCRCPGKLPLIKNWTLKSSTTEKDLQEWVQQFKTFNIGLPLGEVSGYCGIDVDGELGEQYLQDMSKGNLPDTWEFTTGNGRRLLYTIPPGTKTKKFKQSPKGICPECNNIAPQKTEDCPSCGAQNVKWLDPEGGHVECALLCTGQQTVLPPSIHHTGRVYEWTEGHSPWDIDCAEAPKWLIDLIKVDERDIFKSSSSDIVLNLDDEMSNGVGSIEDEFEPTEFNDNIPIEILNNAAVVKTQQKGKSGHKIVVTEEMLTQPIPEGQRDVTMTAIIGHYCANRDLRRLGKNLIMQICKQHNEKYCDPPLPESDIVTKVNYFYEAEQMKEATYKGAKEEKKQFEASKMAVIVKNKLQEDNILLHFDQHSKIYYFTTPDKGPWVPTRNLTLINRWIRGVITNPQYGSPQWDKQSYIEETRKALEELFTVAFKAYDDFDIGAHSDKLSEYIVVNNGMLDWKEGVLLPWDPEYRTTVSFDVDYDPSATCPRFEQYMSEWLPSPTTRAVVQEYLGYCLIPNTKFRKAMFLYGKGKNGKSMLLEFLQGFFGDHKATLSYDGLFQRFGTANLKDKLVNIFDDTTVSFTKDTGIVKNLIAGGTISAEFKGKDHFTFTNVARFIFSAQETPKTSDHSDAWYDRWIFVKFPNKFKASNEKKTEMETAMKEELPGIFNWMVKGLQRLMEQDGFTLSPELSVSAREYRQSNDGVAMFIYNMCRPVEKGESGVTVHELYKVYTVWCEYEGLRALSKRTFTERLEDLGYKKQKGYFEGKPGQTFVAEIVINKECEDFIENKVDYVLAMQL